jgi:predicted transposase YbfD/YdcC
LTQTTVDGKSNEITAIPEILSCLDLKDAVVTIDAMGCQKAIAEKIILAEADYVLALKDNHPQLCDNVSLWLNTEADKGALIVHETVDKDHGRLEIRRYRLSRDISWLSQKPEWAGLQAVGRVKSIRIIGNKTSTEYRYYLSSLTDLPRFAETARGHWAIENSQHWVLDVQFGEDAHRTRKDYSPGNLALIRRMTLNVIRHNGPSKHSLRLRKMRASLRTCFKSCYAARLLRCAVLEILMYV